MFDLDENQKKEGGSTPRTWLCAHTVCVSVCTHVCQRNHSFLFLFEMLEPNKMGTTQRLCCLGHSFISMGQTDKPLRTAMV